MKDWEYLERLNRYIDGEMTSAERVAFEAEVAADPRKRVRLTEYRRMDKAAQRIGATFRADAPQPRVEGNVIWVPRTVRPQRKAVVVQVFGGFGVAAAAWAAVHFGPALLVQQVREPLLAPTVAAAPAAPQVAGPTLASIVQGGTTWWTAGDAGFRAEFTGADAPRRESAVAGTLDRLPRDIEALREVMVPVRRTEPVPGLRVDRPLWAPASEPVRIVTDFTSYER